MAPVKTKEALESLGTAAVRSSAVRADVELRLTKLEQQVDSLFYHFARLDEAVREFVAGEATKPVP